MENKFDDNISASSQSQLNQFKEYAVSHPLLAQVDLSLMSVIREPAGFAHVLVYGPSGVGKTTMIRQITKRLNVRKDHDSHYRFREPSYRNGNGEPLPLLLVETRPPDGAAFNRADYYRTALKLLGEPFYERRMLVDIDSEQGWEKKGRSRTKTAHFNESPELRQALEEAMIKRGVRAVILDEAQHLMKIGNGASGGKALDQLDWIKSMTNVTGVLHILIGTYELLNFRNLSGQASRRGLDIHFPRYLFQHEQDRQDFQGVLLALLKQVPIQTDISELMQHWVYFYERSIGCVGVLKDWLIRAVAAALDQGCDTLTLERLHEYTLSLAQCERMAIEATEGEQKLCYMESRREHLWHLLQMEMTSTSVSGIGVDVSVQETSSIAPIPSPNSNSKSKSTRQKPDDSYKGLASSSEPKKKSTRKKKEQTVEAVESMQSIPMPVGEVPSLSQPKKRQTRKKKETAETSMSTLQAPLTSVDSAESSSNQPPTVETIPSSKPSRSVGRRKPQRDPVGE